jgi:hypothetical protein
LADPARRLEVYDEMDAADLDTEQRQRIGNDAERIRVIREWIAANNPDGLTEQQYLDRVRQELKQAFAGKPVAIRVTPDGLARMLGDGRFKTQFESHTSGGLYDPSLRAEVESERLGLDRDKTDPKERPIYGYLEMGGEIGPAALAKYLRSYGSVQVVLKDQVRSRTTAMVGDTLAEKVARPTPVDDPDWWSWNPTHVPDWWSREPTRHAGKGLGTRDYTSSDEVQYVEAQIHGGVTVDDIEEVVFASEPDGKLQWLLDSRGIRWRVVREQPV